MNVFQRDEFFAKAKEAGIVEDIDRRIEERRREQRLAVIAKISVLPTEDQTELPALGKAASDAYKELQLAEEAHRAADRKYKELSMQVYGAQLKFEGARTSLISQAESLASTVAREAWEDLGMLDALVRDRFRVHTFVESTWLSKKAIETSNQAEIAECRENIKAGRARIMEMQLETTDANEAEAEIFALVGALEAQALELGVDQKQWTARRTPRPAAERAEDAMSKEEGRRKARAESRSVRLAAH